MQSVSVNFVLFIRFRTKGKIIFYLFTLAIVDINISYLPLGQISHCYQANLKVTLSSHLPKQEYLQKKEYLPFLLTAPPECFSLHQKLSVEFHMEMGTSRTTNLLGLCSIHWFLLVTSILLLYSVMNKSHQEEPIKALGQRFSTCGS